MGQSKSAEPGKLREKAMKNFVRLYAFWYGCLGTALATIWHVLAILGRAELPDNVIVVETIFALHSMAAIFTFYRSPLPPRAWQPLFTVTRRRILIAKAILGCTVADFLLCLPAFLFASLRHDAIVQQRLLPLLLTSFVLSNTVYIAIHWAFRPENLFSRTFIAALSNPLGVFFRDRNRIS